MRRRSSGVPVTEASRQPLMRRDPVPTFRRTWSLLDHEIREIHAALTSRTVCRRLRNVAILLAALSVVGLAAARLSVTACERFPRRNILSSIPSGEAEIQWVDPQRLRVTPYASEFLRSEVYAEERMSIFKPRIRYRFVDALPPRTGETYARAYLVSTAPLPFITRSHYAFDIIYRGPAPEYTMTGGSSGEGVTTCLCGFGAAIPIHDWNVGAMY